MSILEAILPKLQKAIKNQNKSSKPTLSVYDKTIVIDNYRTTQSIIISEDTIKITITDHDLIEIDWTDPDILQKLIQHIKTL